MSDSLFTAVDLGAGSGRVFLAGLDESKLLLQQIRRFQYPPSISDGHLRWDIPKIFADINEGLREAAARARELGREIQSIGVDSWGVDYGLIDADGKLIELPVCYRDDRTRGVMEEVFTHVSRHEIFKQTGIQFLSFNTLFQLYAHARAGFPANAHKLLLIPDLINFFLTHNCVSEYTNASTTQMLNAQTREWDSELLDCLSLPKHLLPEIVSAGAEVGPLRAELAAELGIGAVPVVAPATHDTGSAVVGAPLEPGWAYISSGTWSLVGVERDDLLINDEVARHNFTNEGGAFGTIRFLKNVMGLWILESCRREWQQRGVPVDYDGLLRDVVAIEDRGVLIFPDDERFFDPPSMLEAIATQLNETNQTMPSAPAAIAKVILDSLAFRYAAVLKTIESLTNQAIKAVRIIGGGSQNVYLNQATANAARLPVSAGPVEATVIGNVLAQAIASGCFSSLANAREYVSRNMQSRTFMPIDSIACDDAMRRYAEIEARYS
ncbi:MAG TPA: rhamnulokinase family protein [Pyrinomonadaceae bacterium]|nr:rhamnulokinase family protein [Pyrinomonadaceae bacterium]